MKPSMSKEIDARMVTFFSIDRILERAGLQDFAGVEGELLFLKSFLAPISKDENIKDFKDDEEYKEYDADSKDEKAKKKIGRCAAVFGELCKIMKKSGMYGLKKSGTYNEMDEEVVIDE